jgi:hypothetical protein
MDRNLATHVGTVTSGFKLDKWVILNKLHALRQGWDKPVRLNLRRRLVPGRRPMGRRRKVRSSRRSWPCAFSISNKYIPDIPIPKEILTNFTKNFIRIT